MGSGLASIREGFGIGVKDSLGSKLFCLSGSPEPGWHAFHAVSRSCHLSSPCLFYPVNFHLHLSDGGRSQVMLLGYSSLNIYLSLPLRHHWPRQERTLDSEETSPEIGLIQLDVPSQHPVFLEWKVCVLMSQRREFTRAKGQARDQSQKSDGRCQAPVRIWGQPWLWVYSARHVRLPWSQLITAKDTLMPAYCSLCFYGNGLNELMSFTTTAECLVRELLMTMAVSLLCLVHCLGTLQDCDTCLFLIRQFHSLRAKSRCVQSFCLPFEGHASSYDHLFSLVLTISLSHSTVFFFFLLWQITLKSTHNLLLFSLRN